MRAVAIYTKKSELMLIRRATASVSFHTQIVLGLSSMISAQFTL